MAVGEREDGDPGFCESLSEGVQTHLSRCSEAVAENHERRRINAVGQVQPGRATVVSGGEGDVQAGRGLRVGSHCFTASLRAPAPRVVPFRSTSSYTPET